MDGDFANRIGNAVRKPAKAGTTRIKSAAVDGGERMVTSIAWDSGFRRSGLRVGDQIVGADGGLYSNEDVEKHRIAGAPHESAFWDPRGHGDGSETTLLVQRDGEIQSISGTLAASQSYRNGDGKRCYGTGGPAHGEKDGFTYAWRPWYEKFKRDVGIILAGWDYTVGYDTRRKQGQIAEYTDRVAFLRDQYTGPFVDAVVDDFAAMQTMLAGEPRTVTEADLEYRSLGEKRAAQVTAAAKTALEAFRAELGDAVITTPFPAPNPFLEDYSDLIGKVVALPEVGRRDVLFETKRSWYKFGRHQGNYLINRHDPLMQMLYTATDRYAQKVDPFFGGSKLQFFGKIDFAPALVSDAVRNITVIGLTVRPIAALFTDAKDPSKQFFIDMRADHNPSGSFAGENDLFTLEGLSLDAVQTPADVMRVFVDALKRADNKTWRACYADWAVRRTFQKDDTYKYVDTTWTTLDDRYAESLWDKARQRLLDDVYTAEVGFVSEPKVVYDASKQPAQVFDPDDPQIVEEVQLLMNHVSKFDDGYRTFASSTLKRKWTLQRLDQGPWRIVNAQGL